MDKRSEESKFSLEGQKVRLRPFEEKDIERMIYVMTEDIEWQYWDAPWELEEEDAFDPEQYREVSAQRIEKLRRKEETFIHRTLMIERLSDGEFLGRINSYGIDEHYEWAEKGGRFTIGIDIFDREHRRCGYGREAWGLYLDYLRSEGIDEVYTQTWSGNIPARKLIEKYGFVLVHVYENYQKVRGENVDGYSYRLSFN